MGQVKAWYSPTLGRYTTDSPETVAAITSASQSAAGTTLIDPPDDRYLPGMSTTEADGDVKIIGPRLKELAVVASTYGLVIPITFGVRRLNGNIIWSLPLIERKSSSKSGGGGGKGGDDSPTTKETTYSYFGTFAVSFGYPSPIDLGARDLLRVWLDGTLVMDKRSTGRSKMKAVNYNFYPGNETQLADPIMKAELGAANVPAYRGQMYLVMKELPLAAFGNRIPVVTIEVGDATTKETIIATSVAVDDDDTFSEHRASPIIDLVRMRMYAPTESGAIDYIYHYDLNTDEFLYRVPLQTGYTFNENMGYIPWLNALVFSSDIADDDLAIVDVNTGIVTHFTADILTNGGVDQLMPVLVYGVNGLTTYIVSTDTFNEMHVLKVVAPEAPATIGTIELLYSFANAGNNGGKGPIQGLQGLGYTECFMIGASTALHKFTITEGAVSPGAGITHNTAFYTASANISAGHYYAPDNSIILILSNGQIRKIDAATGAEIWSNTDANNFSIVATRNAWLSDVSTGFWTVISNATSVNEINIATGEVTNYTTGAHGLSGIGGCDAASRSIIGAATADGLFKRVYYDRLADERMTLADYIEGVATLAGFNVATQIEIDSEIDDVIDGAIVTEITDFRSIVMNLAPLFRLDIIESGGKIKIIRKAADAAADDFEIPETDLALPEGSDANTPVLTMTREQEIAIPERVFVKYIDKSLGYKWNTAVATRSRQIETNVSDNQITYQVFIVMTAAEAKAAANKALWSAWNSRSSFEFLLPQEYLDLEPSDVGTVTANGITYTVRAVEVSYNADFTVGVRAQGYLTDYPISIEADPGAGYEQTIPVPSLSQIIPLDIPLILPQADLSVVAPGSFPLHVFVAPQMTDPWPGGEGYMSRNFVEYERIAVNNADGVVAFCMNALAAPVHDVYATDDDNDLTIFVTAGDSDFLATITDAEYLGIKNMAAVGTNGRWELICWRDVVANADGSYTLSHLQRGLKGTDHNVGNHAIGDTFVMLSTEWIDTKGLQFSDIGTAISFKAVGYNQHIDEVIPTAIPIEGYGGQPWPPGNVEMVREADGDVVVTWKRRSRTIENELQDGHDDVPITDYEEDDYQLTFYRNRWVEDGMPDVEHADGEDEGFVTTVSGVQTYTLTATQIEDNELNAYVDPVSMILTPSNVYPENQYGLSDELNFRYIYVKIQQKCNMTGVAYGPGRKELIFVA